LPGFHAQTKSLDELNKKIIEATELYIEIDKDRINKTIEFIDF